MLSVYLQFFLICHSDGVLLVAVTAKYFLATLAKPE